jgi:hypothetical protein
MLPGSIELQQRQPLLASTRDKSRFMARCASVLSDYYYTFLVFWLRDGFRLASCFKILQHPNLNIQVKTA